MAVIGRKQPLRQQSIGIAIKNVQQSPAHFRACQALLKVTLKWPNLTFSLKSWLFVMFRSCLGSLVMRADIQRKPLGFQELTSPVYRCVSFCVTRLTRS